MTNKMICPFCGEELDLAFEMLKDIKNDPDTNNELTQEIADRLSEIKALNKRGEK